MKVFLKTICFLFIIKSTAQIKSNFSLETSTGYEYNIFKSPDSFLDNGVLKNQNDLYKNSLFQEGGIRFFAKKKWGKQSLSFRFNPKGIYYFSEVTSSYFTFLSGLRYMNELNRKTTWQINSWYKIKNREGENIDGSELNFPLGNNHFGLATSLDFRLYKQNRSFVKVTYGNRDYKTSATHDLSYNSLGINTIIRNVFKRKAGWHSYGIEANFNTKFFNQKELATNTSAHFNWKDMSAGLFYRYPINKALDLKPSFTFKKRLDIKQDKFTYTQLKPSLDLVYKKDKLEMNLTTSYVNRKYKTLLATDNNGDDLGKLNYNYYQLKLVAERKFSKKLSMLASAFLNNRTSNKTNIQSIYFRGYDYYNVSIGLKYRF